MTFGEGQVERALIVCSAGVHIGSIGEQDLDHGAVAGLSGGMQSGPTDFLARVDVGSAFGEQLHEIDMGSCGGGMQRSVLHGVSGTRVYLSAAFEQCVGQIGVAEEGGEVQRSPAVGAVRFEESGIAIDFSEYLGDAPGNAGIKDVELRVQAQQVSRDVVLPVVLGQEERRLTRFVGGFEQRRIFGESSADTGQIAALDLLLKGFYGRHGQAAGINTSSVLFSSQSR